MLIEFRVKNFRSFKEEQVFSMVAGKDKTLKHNVFESCGFSLLKSSALYGHNASGKSNLLKGLYAMKKIIMTSTDLESDSLGEYVDSFQFNSVCKNQASRFEITFLHENVRYQYGFSANKNRIFDEWLFSYPKKRAQKWFVRKFEEDKQTTSWYINKTYLKGGEESLNQLKEKTRENSLFLTVGSQWNNLHLSEVYNFFKDSLRVHLFKSDFLGETASYLVDSLDADIINNNYKKLILKGMKLADLGIEDIKVEKSNINVPNEFLEQFKEESRTKLIESFQEEKALKITFKHQVQDEESNGALPYSEESLGTQEYFELLGPWLEAIARGRTLFVDELETSLHPLLLSRLIKLWQDKKVNTSGAQLVFASHETTLLNSDLFRRDQIWFTEKNKTGATEIYSLLEYKPRKGEALQKGYLSGRYGAIPILEDFELNEL